MRPISSVALSYPLRAGAHRLRWLRGVAGLAMTLAATTAAAQADARFTHAFADMGEARDDDRFGTAVALSGDRAIIGMPNDETSENDDVGAAYVYARVNGVWELERKFTPGLADAGAGFGSSVAIDTDIVVVGAPRRDIDALTDAGVAYIYTRNASTGIWSLSTTLEAADSAAGDLFGSSVAVFDTYLLVGARSDNNGLGANQGSVYVFRRQVNGSWTQEAKLTQADATGSDNFGVSLAISAGASGVTAVIGADRHDVSGNNEAGAAYVFFRGGSGWVQQGKLLPNTIAAGDRFGTSVDVQGDRAVVGAPLKDTNGTDNGNIYIYSRSGGTWSPSGSLPGAGAGHRFGQGVAVFGTRVLGGSPGAPVDGNPARGNVRGFTLSGSDWVLQSTLLPGNPQFESSFGAAVALNGSTAMVGAPLFDRYGNSDIGQVTVFDDAAAVQTLDRGDGIADDLGGYSVSVSGDTVLYGAPGENLADIGDAGAAYVFVRSGNAWTQQAKLTAGSLVTSTPDFGTSVAIDGDTILVSSPLGGTQDQGLVFVFVRSGGTWTQQATVSGFDSANGDLFGQAVALRGNLAVIGSPGDDIGAAANRGSVRVFFRSGTDWTETAQRTNPGGAAGDQFGRAIAMTADAVVVTANAADPPGDPDAGIVYAYARTASTLAADPTLLSDTFNRAGDFFGYAVAADGFRAVVGAPLQDAFGSMNNPDHGAAYVFDRVPTEVVFADGFE